jgi:voltage-gated potassium channel
MNALIAIIVAGFVALFFLRLTLSTVRIMLRNQQTRGILLLATTYIFLGALAYSYIEGWPLDDAVYFTVVMLTTIGFGDLAPVTDVGRLFTIVYVILGLGILSAFIGAVVDAYAELRRARSQQSNTASSSDAVPTHTEHAE